MHAFLSQGNILEVCGGFHLSNSSFLILKVEDSYSNNICTDENAFSSLEMGLPVEKVGHFEDDGKRYFILKSKARINTSNSELSHILSGREIQIVTLVALGYCNKQISGQLDISEWTVAAHLRRIFSKLSVESRAAMVFRCSELVNQLLQLCSVKTDYSAADTLPDFAGESEINELLGCVDIQQLKKLFVETKN